MSDERKFTRQVRFSRPFWIAVALLGAVAIVGIIPWRTRPICKVGKIDVETANILAAIKFYRARFGDFSTTDASTISLSIRGKDHRQTVFLDCPVRMVSPAGELLDPWATAYKFYGSGDEIIIRSAGPNRRFDSSAVPDCDDYFR